MKPQAAQDKPPAVPEQAVVTHVNNVNQTRELCPPGSGEKMFIMFIVVTIVIFIIIRIIIYIVRHCSLNRILFFFHIKTQNIKRPSCRQDGGVMRMMII